MIIFLINQKVLTSAFYGIHDNHAKISQTVWYKIAGCCFSNIEPIKYIFFDIRKVNLYHSICMILTATLQVNLPPPLYCTQSKWIYCKFILATLYLWIFNGMNPGHEEPLGKNEFIEKRKTKQNKTTQQSLLSLLPGNCESNCTLPPPAPNLQPSYELSTSSLYWKTEASSRKSWKSILLEKKIEQPLIGW